MATVAEYNFSENLNDSAGANTGVGVGTPTYGPSLVPSENSGKSLVVNGSTQYVKVPNAASLQITGTYWHTAWVSFTSFTGNQVIYMKGSEDYFLYRSSGEAGGLIAGHRDSGAASHEVSIASPEIVLNREYRVDVVYDGAKLRLFMNGLQVSEAACTSGPRSTTGELGLCAEPTGGEKHAGPVDKMVFRNSGGSAAEIIAQYREQTPTIFSDNFATGTRAKWFTEDKEGTGAGITFTKTSPAPPSGEYAMVANVPSEAKRAELSPGRLNFSEGDDIYVDYWLWNGAAPQSGKTWNVFGQLHQKGTVNSPSFAFEQLFGNGFIYGGATGTTEIFKGSLIPLETWTRITFRVLHSASSSTGKVEFWINKAKQTLTNGQKSMTLQTLQDEYNYFKLGNYRDPTTTTTGKAAFANLSLSRSLPFTEETEITVAKTGPAGFALDSKNRLAAAQSKGNAKIEFGEEWEQNSFVRDKKYRLVVTTSTTGARISNGFLRDPEGRLVVTTSTENAVVRNGLLRAPNYALVVSESEAGAMKNGFYRDSNYAVTMIGF